jgi:dipeptidyl aminopeptidase/acylaminoacyl peptidase
MHTALLFVLALCPPPAARAVSPQGRAFEITDYYRAAFVGAPALSPDGDWVVFDVRRYDVAGDKSWSELWRVRSDGSSRRRITQGQHDDSSPRFSPDGKRILFVSSRGGSSQLWTMPVDGGEAVQLGDFAPGVADPLWSPDGTQIAVTSEVWPECGADEDCNSKRSEAGSKGKLSVHVADELLYRHWTSWKQGTVPHVLLFDASSGEPVADLTPGAHESPAFSLGGGGSYAFSPDGGHLIFVSNRDERQAESTNVDLWQVDLPRGEARNLTAANKGWDGSPVFSPDGSKLAYLSQAAPAFESDLRRLAVMDVAGGAPRYLTSREGFDDMVVDLRWAPDGRSIFFSAEVDGRTPILRVDLADGRIETVLTHGLIGGFEITPDGKHIVYSTRTIDAPPEIYTAPIAGGERRALTDFNAALRAEVDIRPAEELWIDCAGGYTVQCFVVKPHGFQEGRRYPLILNVHGGPQTQWSDAFRGDWQVYPGKGYVVAFANPTGSTGRGQPFVDAISKDWGGRVYRDLMQVADALEKLPYVDPERMGAMGWSYGGYMMMWMQGHTQRFKCQASMMGLYDLRSFYGATEELWFPEYDMGGTPWESEHYERWSPSNFVAEFKTPALVITGERDYRVPYTQSLQYFTALQKRGVDSRLVVLPEAGHWPSWREMIFYYNAHLDWFARYLGGEPAPYDVLEHARQRGIPKPPPPAD